MKETFLTFLFLLLLPCLSAFGDVVYFGKNCKRVTRSNMLTRPTNRVYVNGLLVNEDKKKIERPIRDCWLHLNNPLRGRKTMYHFEANYRGGSGKFNGNFVQFYDEPGIVFDPMRYGHSLHGIIAIGLENQDSRNPTYLDVPGGLTIELEPEMSCLYYFSGLSNFEKTTFKVRSDVYFGHLYQILYYNNNTDGEFLKKEYESIDYEPYQNRYIDVNMFHQFYPNYPNLN